MRAWPGRKARVTPAPLAGKDQVTEVPAVLPLVVIEALAADQLIATINGNRLAATPITRSELGTAIAEIVAQLGTPARVELHEQDGTVHADIIRPPQPRSPFAPPEHAPVAPNPPTLAELSGEGFIPGEDVALAVIVTHSSAGPTGRARGLLDTRASLQVTGEAILLGRISGTTVVDRID